MNPGGAWVADGRGLSQEAIMSTVATAVPSLRACSDEQRRLDPRLRAKLVVKWRIRHRRKPWGVEVISNELKNTFFASCVVEILKTLRFPAHTTEGQPIVMPFKF